MFYTLNLDTNNYVLSISHTPNDNIELDLSLYDLKHLSCYQFINGSLILDENKLNELKQKENKATIEEQIETLRQELATYDYIGIKISMGVSTKEEYADKLLHQVYRNLPREPRNGPSRRMVRQQRRHLCLHHRDP